MGFLFPVSNQRDFNEQLAELKSAHPDATHHCYAWRIHPHKIEEFAQDDGEPSGTAGLPILNQLKSYEVVNAALVVVRYYGGTKLGKSGLIEAYRRCAEQCLGPADLHPIQLIWEVRIEYPYDKQNTIETLSHQFGLQELDARYTERVSLTVACPLKHHAALKQKLQQLEHQNIESTFLDKSYL